MNQCAINWKVYLAEYTEMCENILEDLMWLQQL